MLELSRPVRLLAASIALIAGFVDAIGFVGYGGTFVSFMSGNSTRIGAQAASVELQVIGLTAAIVAAFVGGVAIGQALGGTRDHRRRVRVLSLVALSLAAAALVAQPAGPFFALLAAAFGMGAINTVFASSPLPVGLTYMTGTLVKLGQSLGQRLRGETPPHELPYLVHWFALVLGAALGASAYARWGFSALWYATGAVGLLAMRLTMATR